MIHHMYTFVEKYANEHALLRIPYILYFTFENVPFNID